MRTRFLSLVLVLAALTAAWCPGKAFAASVSARDLSSLGLYAVEAACVQTPPETDGVMGAGEYPASRTVSPGDGMCLVAVETGEDLTANAEKILGFDINGVRMTYGVAYDKTTAFFCLRLTSPTESVLQEISLSDIDGAATLLFHAGLSQSSDLKAFSSAWKGSYYVHDGKSVGATGQIIRYDAEGEIMERNYRSFGKTPSGPYYEDESGFLWDGAGYLRRSAFRLIRNGNGVELTLESAVPLTELLLTVPASQRNTVAERFQNGTGPVYGCFSAGIVLYVGSDAGSRLILGTFCGTADRGIIAPAVLPAPLYWRGTPPSSVPPRNLPSAGSEAQEAPDGSDLLAPDTEIVYVLPDDPDLTDLTDKAEETEDEPELPYDLEPIPSRDGEDIESFEEKQNELSPWIGVFAGAFLCLAALFLFLAVRAMDKRERRRREEEEKKIADRKNEREAKRKTGRSPGVVQRRRRR